MIGKLTSDQLKNLVFKHLTYKRDEVLVRPGIGEDCAVVSFGDNALVISTDPITGTGAELGKLAVTINLNDIASNGVAPLGLMLTILAPPGTTLDEIEGVMAQAGAEAAKHKVEIIGGHTEITEAVNRMVISAVAIGKQPTQDVIKMERISVGDRILMTKAVGLEGSGILAFEREEDLVKVLGSQGIQEAKSLLDHTSVVKEGVICGRFGVSAMHDITEGGLLGAVWELCHGAGVGCVVDASAIPIYAVTQDICDHFDIDPLGLISSGAMLIIAPENVAQEVCDALFLAGVAVQEIGEITKEEMLIDMDGELFEIDPPSGDALYEALSS